ncbi:zf-BED domain-containing protein/DUF659 domain-containing protein/Dimer_Tnp_hAT domain-containing protein [Senna tora]|uniref:Zf-BED domain-containing protein/DUF659 domain-containing protein/Dimer_Tnp_hAT domain-containing protein n=1 Tax=Senna tora TaxID=362788 RepID=A0A834TSA3_9FABA|nr:zf-BED domain-containing protein/DUF659 domain-containing protein/Dimer_Tnp_hAT domain-containing protein [Senna tora]
MEPPHQPPSAENIDGNRNNIGTASASGSGVVGHNRKTKNALGSRSDIGWKHGYTVEGDSRKVICKYCGNTYTGGIYRFKHHFAGTRDNVEPCIFVPDNVRKEMLTILVKNMTSPKENYSVAELGDTESRPTVSENLIRSAFKKQVVVAGAGGSRSTQSIINHLLKKDLREEASRQIARFFYTSAIPFNCVKNPDFEKMCELIAKHGSGFKPPTFYEINNKKGAKDYNFYLFEDNANYYVKALYKSRFASIEAGKKAERVVLSNKFWKNVVVCLKAAYPLINVLRLVDADDNPAMGFIYEEMDKAKETIQINFKNVRKSYEPVWKIIDERWEAQFHKPLHAAAYYLNPHFHYISQFKADIGVKRGLYECMDKMLTMDEKHKVDFQLEMFKEAKGLFGIESAMYMRCRKQPGQWWDSYGDQCPELQKFAIRILSLTGSSSGCECNWSAFEMVHTKRRNRLQQKKMNNLVFVMYNQKLKDRKARELADLDNIPSDDEWITEDVVIREEEEGEDVAFEVMMRTRP